MIVVIVSMVDWEFSGCISNGKKIHHRLYVALPTWICYFHTCFTHDRRFATTLPIQATDHYIASEYIRSPHVKYRKYSSTAPPELWHHRLALVDCTVVVIPPLLANNTTNNKTQVSVLVHPVVFEKNPRNCCGVEKEYQTLIRSLGKLDFWLCSTDGGPPRAIFHRLGVLILISGQDRRPVTIRGYQRSPPWFCVQWG